MQQLPYERTVVAVSAVAALELVIADTVLRKRAQAFGKPLIELQNTRFKLAEAHTAATIGRVFVDHASTRVIDGSRSTPSRRRWRSGGSPTRQWRQIDECLQLHGGYGYMLEYPVTRAFMDARVQRIYAGTNEIMKVIVVRARSSGAVACPRHELPVTIDDVGARPRSSTATSGARPCSAARCSARASGSRPSCSSARSVQDLRRVRVRASRSSRPRSALLAARRHPLGRESRGRGRAGRARARHERARDDAELGEPRQGGRDLGVCRRGTGRLRIGRCDRGACAHARRCASRPAAA